MLMVIVLLALAGLGGWLSFERSAAVAARPSRAPLGRHSGDASTRGVGLLA
jgi:hypothetical protein